MLSYFNIELIRSVNESSNFLQHCTSAYGPAARVGGEGSTIRYRDSVITRSVICLIGLFILCQVPASILNYIHVVDANHPLLYISYEVSNFLILLNSAVGTFMSAVRSACRRRLGQFLRLHMLQSEVSSSTGSRLFLHENAYEHDPANVKPSVAQTRQFSHTPACPESIRRQYRSHHLSLSHLL